MSRDTNIAPAEKELMVAELRNWGDLRPSIDFIGDPA
jgi:hypothetical protein